MLKAVSLFSGAGGLDWGFKELGFKIVFANDILSAPMQTYARNFGLKLSHCQPGRRHATAPGEALVCDVAQVDFSGLAGIEVDAVLGGPPCQDFSIVRGPEWDRRGIGVERGRLYAHFVRALAQLQPKIFIFENVPGLVSANGGLAYRVILDDFRELNLRWEEVKKYTGVNDCKHKPYGYEILFSGVVDFSALGVPQRRERLIVVGIRRDLVKDPRDLRRMRSIVSRVLEGANQPFRKYPLSPNEVFEGRALPDLRERYREVMVEWSGVWEEVGTERALRWKREVWDKLTFDVVKDYLLANSVGSWSERELEEAWKAHELILRELGYLGRRVCEEPPLDGTCEPPEDTLEVRERMKRIPFGENHEFVRGTKWHVEGKGISLVYRRLHPLRPSYTVVAYGGGGTHGYHYERSRATLTLRERARLQTFPDSFLFHGRKTEIRAQIGEAVPPLASKRIAEAVSYLISAYMN